MKLVLINPQAHDRPGLAQNVRSRHPPLNLAILAGLTPSDWDVTILDENYERAEIVSDADLVGITAFTSQAVRAYELADQYRAAGVPVVLGGIHVWARPDEAARHADAVMIGEADWPWLWWGVCDDLTHGMRRMEYRGKRPEEFALPKRSLLRPDYQVDSLQTSRGCPNRCAFCSVHEFSGRNYRRQPVDLVVRDLAAIKSPHVFVIDDNFTGFSPQHSRDAVAILGEMAGFQKEFIVQCPVHVCDNEAVLAAAAAAGVRLIFVGIEAGDWAGLASVAKTSNLRHGYDFTAVHRAGMGVIGSFVMGLDTDTPAVLRSRARMMAECGCDVLQLTVLTPLPGTRLFDQLLAQGRLLYTDFPADWSRYDFTELVYLPRGFRSQAEFYDLMAEIVDRLWSDVQIKSMAQRTYDCTGSRATTTFAHWINYQYREVMRAKAALWTQGAV